MQSGQTGATAGASPAAPGGAAAAGSPAVTTGGAAAAKSPAAKGTMSNAQIRKHARAQTALQQKAPDLYSKLEQQKTPVDQLSADEKKQLEEALKPLGYTVSQFSREHQMVMANPQLQSRIQRAEQAAKKGGAGATAGASPAAGAGAAAGASPPGTTGAAAGASPPGQTGAAAGASPGMSPGAASGAQPTTSPK
jgi:hypothetical protein